MNHRLQSIHALRGVAAFAVVLYHARWFEHLYLPGCPVSPDWFAFGVYGVELFFVLSGVVIVLSSGRMHGVSGAFQFLARRCARIYPLYWIATLLLLAVNAVVYLCIPPAELTSRTILQSMLLVPHEPAPILAVGWTMVFEMYFYLGFALLLLLPRKQLPAALVCWALAILSAKTMTHADAPFFLRVASHLYTLLFLAGAAIGVAVERGRKVSSLAALVPIALIAGAALLVAQTISGPWPAGPTPGAPWQRIAWFGLPCALLVWSLISMEAPATASKLGVLRAALKRIGAVLGDASYAIYLLHIPVFYALTGLTEVLGLSVGEQYPLRLVRIGAYVATGTLAGIGMHYAVEAPILARLRKFIDTHLFLRCETINTSPRITATATIPRVD